MINTVNRFLYWKNCFVLCDSKVAMDITIFVIFRF